MKKSNSNSFNVIINGKSKRKNHMLSNSTTASSMFGLYKVCGVNKINVNQKMNRTRTRTPNLDKLLTNLKKEINDFSYPLLTETKSSYSNLLLNNESNDVNILKEKNSLLEKKLNNSNALLADLIEKASLYEKLYEDEKKKNYELQRENDYLKKKMNSLMY